MKHRSKVQIPDRYIGAESHVTSRSFEDRQRARMRQAQAERSKPKPAPRTAPIP